MASDLFTDKTAVFKKLKSKSENKVFFKQHGWNDGGKLEAKYTSRAAELYKQLLTKEVAKNSAEELAIVSPAIVSEPPPAVINGVADIKIYEIPKDNRSVCKIEKSDIPSLKTPHPVYVSSIKKPLGAKKAGKTGGLGARKLTSKVNACPYTF